MRGIYLVDLMAARADGESGEDFAPLDQTPSLPDEQDFPPLMHGAPDRSP